MDIKCHISENAPCIFQNAARSWYKCALLFKICKAHFGKSKAHFYRTVLFQLNKGITKQQNMICYILPNASILIGFGRFYIGLWLYIKTGRESANTLPPRLYPNNSFSAFSTASKLKPPITRCIKFSMWSLHRLPILPAWV